MWLCKQADLSSRFFFSSSHFLVFFSPFMDFHFFFLLLALRPIYGDVSFYIYNF